MAAKGGTVMAEEEKFFTSGETAKLLGISQDTLSRWEKKGTFIPHHVLQNGYRYYSAEQIRHFFITNSAKIESKSLKLQKSGKSKSEQKSVDKTTSPSSEKDRPIFRLYVDSGTGKKWDDYYAMRSGKTNALAFVSNPKSFKRVSEYVGEQEIFSDDDKFSFLEKMHNVTIILDNDHLDNVNATIAKCVFWIQLMFTDRLGCDHAPEEIIEKARYMKWNISDYMRLCGLRDRKSAIDSMKKILSLLSHAEIQWQEEVIVRDSNGQPVVLGTYKGKDGKTKVKIKRAMQTYRGVFISTRGLKPIGGCFDYWINKEFATYLAHAGVIAVHEGIFKLNARQHPSAITLAAKLLEYSGINKGTSQAEIISVKSALNSMPLIPSYENLTGLQKVTQSDGNVKEYEKHGNNGGWRARIQKPFEESFDALVAKGILKKWQYRCDHIPTDYEDFSNQYIIYELSSKNE